jgi:hypothetical protein
MRIMKKKIVNFLWKWVKFANKNPKIMRKMAFSGLVVYSIFLLSFIAKRQFDTYFWFWFWIWVWSLVDWVTTCISFQEPKDVGEVDDYDDLR